MLVFNVKVRYLTTASDNIYLLLIEDIRLRGGGALYGRVEVYYNGVWGTVCDDSFNINDGHVICRQLGRTRGARSVYQRARYGQGRGQIWLDNLQCLGTESRIGFCPSNPLGNHNCNHREDASVCCL